MLWGPAARASAAACVSKTPITCVFSHMLEHVTRKMDMGMRVGQC